MSSGRQPFPHLDSNQDKGFQRPVCCHYTMGESWAFGPQVFIYTILSVFTERLRHVASRIVCFPRTNTHVIRRTGSLDRGARGRCRTVRRPSRPRIRRGWRWPAAGRSTGRASHPMKALEKRDSLKEPENFSAWVNRIAINNCKMYFRKNPRTAEEESEKIIDDTPDSELIPDDYADSEEKRRIIMNIIDTALTDEQRQTIILFYFDMMSVAEIAEIMECSVGTVTSRLSAARKKIREAVLIYEKKNNDRLHAVMPIPVLSKIFMQECQHLKLPELSVFSKASAMEVVPDKYPENVHRFPSARQ